MEEKKRDWRKYYNKEAANRATAKYDKKAAVWIAGIKCMRKTEQDIIDRLESMPNKQGYIKKLIRDDIARDSADT